MIKATPIAAEQIQVVEHIGLGLMREGRYDEATVLMTIVLAWRYSPVTSLEDELADEYEREWGDRMADLYGGKVIDFPGHSVKV